MMPPMNNPMMAMLQMARNGGNPMQMLQQMAGQNPQAAQAMRLIQGKNPQQLPPNCGEHGKAERDLS